MRRIDRILLSAATLLAAWLFVYLDPLPAVVHIDARAKSVVDAVRADWVARPRTGFCF